MASGVEGTNFEPHSPREEAGAGGDAAADAEAQQRRQEADDRWRMAIDRARGLGEDVVASFRSSPATTAAVWISCISTFFVVLALFPPWYEVRAHIDEIDARMDGSVSLFQVHVCQKLDRTEVAPGYGCFNYRLMNAPRRLDYFRGAGAAAAVFIIFAGLLSIFASILSYHFRVGTLRGLLRGQHAVVQRFAERSWIVGLHGVVAFLLFLAWVIYAAHVNRHKSTASLQLLANGAVPDRAHFTGGFGCAVFAWLTHIAAACLLHFFPGDGNGPAQALHDGEDEDPLEASAPPAWTGSAGLEADEGPEAEGEGAAAAPAAVQLDLEAPAGSLDEFTGDQAGSAEPAVPAGGDDEDEEEDGGGLGGAPARRAGSLGSDDEAEEPAGVADLGAGAEDDDTFV